MSIQTHSSCTVCNSKNLEDLPRYNAAFLCKCKDCGFVFSKRIPSEKDLITYYSDDYDRTRYFSQITHKRYAEILTDFEPLRNTNRILDVGCGYGFFLSVAKEKGWEVYGTELADKTIAYCSKIGIKMHAGDLNSNSFEDAYFDVIVGIEMIEHLVSPSEFIEQAYRLLRPGGRIYLTTPNFNSILRYRLKEKSDIIEYPNHLGYYTPKTLRKLLEAHSFKKKRIQTTGLSITRIKTSQGKSNQEFVSETSDDEMLRFKIENSAILRFFKNVINWKLNLFKIGNSIKAEFEK